MVKLVRDQGIHKMTFSKAVRQELCVNLPSSGHHNILTTCCKTIQAERSPRLLSHMKHYDGDIRIFVDEKKFMVDEDGNYRNSQVIMYNPSIITSAMHSKNPALIMVFEAVASD